MVVVVVDVTVVVVVVVVVVVIVVVIVVVVVVVIVVVMVIVVVVVIVDVTVVVVVVIGNIFVVVVVVVVVVFVVVDVFAAVVSISDTCAVSRPDRLENKILLSRSQSLSRKSGPVFIAISKVWSRRCRRCSCPRCLTSTRYFRCRRHCHSPVVRRHDHPNRRLERRRRRYTQTSSPGAITRFDIVTHTQTNSPVASTSSTS